MTNGDALVTGAGGGKSVMIMLTDYSNGNDMIVGKPGIKSLKDLKGKKVGLEVGFVEHLLLLNGLQEGRHEGERRHAGQRQDQRDAAGARLRRGRRDRRLAADLRPGDEGRARLASPIYTSADEPGLIYDVLAVNPASLSAQRADWVKVVKVWDRVVALHQRSRRPRTMPSRSWPPASGLTPEAYKPLLKGTHLLDLAEGKKVFDKGDGFGSLYGSTKIADDFNVKNEVYKEPQDVDSYIDPSLTNAVRQWLQRRRDRTSWERRGWRRSERDGFRCCKPIPPRAKLVIGCLSFVLPIAGLVHRQLRPVRLASARCSSPMPGAVDYFQPGMRMRQGRLRRRGRRGAQAQNEAPAARRAGQSRSICRRRMRW